MKHWPSEPVTPRRRSASGSASDVDVELQTRQQEQKRLEEQLSLRLARLRETSSPQPTLVPPLRPRVLPREGPAPVSPAQPISPAPRQPEGHWQLLEETVERVARLESCCLSTVPAMRVQLNHLEQRLDNGGPQVDLRLSVQEDWQVAMASVRRDVLQEVSKLEASIRGRLSVLMEEVQSMRQAKSSQGANESELLQRAAQVAESNSSTLEQVKLLQGTLELGIKSEIAGVQGLFDDTQRLGLELTSHAAEDAQRVESALMKLQLAEEEVASSSKVAQSLLRDADRRSKSIDDHCSEFRQESAVVGTRQQELHSELQKELKHMEMRICDSQQEQDAQRLHLEAMMRETLRSEMRSAKDSTLQHVDDAVQSNRAEAAQQQKQFVTLRSELEDLRSRWSETEDLLRSQQHKSQEALTECRSTSLATVEELKLKLATQLEDLSHGCASASSAAEVARRVAAGAKVNLEELASRHEDTESRFQDELLKIKRAAESQGLLQREELTELETELKSFQSLHSTHHEVLQKLDEVRVRDKEELIEVVEQGAARQDQTFQRLEAAIREGALHSQEVEAELQELAQQTTVTLRRGQEMLKDFEKVFEGRCQTHLEHCKMSTSATCTEAQRNVEVHMEKLQEHTTSVLRKAEEQLSDTRRRADEAQAAYDMAASSAASAQAAQCVVEAKLAQTEAFGEEFREALESMCGKHMDLCTALELQQASSFRSAQAEIEALAATLREEAQVRSQQVDQDVSASLRKAEHQALEATSQAEEAQAACRAASFASSSASSVVQQVEEASAGLKKFVGDQQEVLVQCFKELSKVALACSIQSLGTPNTAQDAELSQRLADVLGVYAARQQDSKATLDEAQRSSRNLSTLVSTLSSTLTQLRDATAVTSAPPAPLSPVSSGPWHEASPATSPGLQVAMESRPPRPPSLVIAWPSRDA